MLRIIKAVLLLPLAAIIVSIGVANRQAVTLFLEPWSRGEGGLSFTLPLFVVVFAALALGIVIGSISSWLAQGKNRKAGRVARKERDVLAKECANLKAQLPLSSSITPR